MSTAPEITVQAPLRIRMSDEDVANLIDCAGYGIGYWTRTAEFDRDTKTYRVVEGHEELPKDEEPADKTLTFADIRRAFAELASEGLLPDWQMREIRENDLGFDATVADMTIQKAVFGKITFG
ncbi:hypothetical protein [Arthrobacter koreensis]|uniref:hypothetical protein n=1 Tax=Arthrobacter koreensis TaxID=199136 RepID=UPI003806AB22